MRATTFLMLLLAQTPFIESLRAPGPIAQHAAKMTLYDALIGDWEADVIDYDVDGNKLTGKGEWHFAWVLEGRAIQDVWISPKRSERNTKQAAANRYGTSIRVYDPAIDAWHVTWINPVSGAFNTLIGRKEGETILQEGTDGGRKIRWIFDDITPRSFHWRGEFSEDEGRTWRVASEFFGRRVSPLSAQAAFPELLADQPDPKFHDQAITLSQLAGAWTWEGAEFREDGTRAVTDKGELHFHWILDGRAMQDVWMETERSDGDALVLGTTVRFYDPKTATWRATWIDPANNAMKAITGRRIGDDIVFEGTSSNGTQFRWIFSEIKSDSFRWHAERFIGGKWMLYEDLRARRKAIK